LVKKERVSLDRYLRRGLKSEYDHTSINNRREAIDYGVEG
jgi:hypothetical protein